MKTVKKSIKPIPETINYTTPKKIYYYFKIKIKSNAKDCFQAIFVVSFKWSRFAKKNNNNSNNKNANILVYFQHSK